MYIPQLFDHFILYAATHIDFNIQRLIQPNCISPCDVPMQKGIEHLSLKDVLQPIKNLKADVRRKALMRLEYEGLHKCEAITTPGARFYNDAAGFAMNRYAYYVCFKCKKVSFGTSRIDLFESLCLFHICHLYVHNKHFKLST